MNKVRKALHALHNLEIMATNIYRCQISDSMPELKIDLIAAMKNEMGHIQDFLVKLFEYGLKPVWYRWIFWMAGWIIGTFSRFGGKKAILRAGIWTESKAVRHYEELLHAAPWDQPTAEVIEKDRQDECVHLNLWKTLLDEN
ncbi:demethoxyubiquinone hydroxylase family protein [bacterium]|nr:demethoxyubiquinone hydroxylase family protein [bacterium]